ncbi:MAG TPA: DNA recombination protein RmuC [bacterium]|nr:DNA recombination protein RmuC [bacterium]
MTDTLWVAVAAALGAAGGAGGTWVLVRTRGQRRAMEEATRRSAAEAAVGAERERRQESEARWLAAQDGEREAREELARVRERVEAADRASREQKEFLERSRKELEDSFRALSSLALRGNNEEFLRLAEERWKSAREQAAHDLEDRRRSIETLVGPLREALGKLEDRTGEIEKARQGAYQGLEKQLEGLVRATASLEQRTTSLTAALRGSRTQGRWGEIALRNVVELAGMSEHVDFAEQVAVADGRRPDMVVRLPGERFIAVDSKVSLNAYLEAVDATTEEERMRALDQHVAALRTHIRTLAGRDYADSVEGNVDLVVMFLPGDAFLGAAFERNPDLQAEALRSRILVATPTTLVALLRTVAIYWQQRALAENAQQIADVARELYERGARFGAHLGRMGKGLEDAVSAFNDAVGSFERRFLPMGRRLDEMKALDAPKRTLEAPPPVDEVPRRALDAAADDDLATLPLFDLPGAPDATRRDDPAGDR